MICARLVLTRSAVGLMRAKSCAVTMPCVSAFSGRCKLSTSAVAKNSSRLGATSKTRLACPRHRAFPTPAQDAHLKCLPDPRDKAADAAKSIDAECLAHHPGSQRAEPQAGFEPLHLLRNMAQGSKDQPPGEFGTEPIHLSPRDVHHWHALRLIIASAPKDRARSRRASSGSLTRQRAPFSLATVAP